MTSNIINADEPIKILQVVPNMQSGGLENYIMNMLRNIDRDKFHFDFLEHHSARSFFDGEIESLGCTIHRIPVIDDKNVLRYRKELKQLFAEEQYQIIHSHMSSTAFIHLKEAERSNIPVRIIHSHNASCLRTPKGIVKNALARRAKLHANIRLACSTEAGHFLYGASSFVLAKNAINTKRFSFDQGKREDTRNNLGIDSSTFVIGHIGRFNLQKNHKFLIRIFNEFHQIMPNSKLILLGDGEEKSTIHNEVSALGLEQSVLFEEVSDTPENYYAAFDAFVLPSLFEGLPLVGIEAQCSGLPCFFASTITQEADVSDRAHYLDLDIGPRAWAEELLLISRSNNRYGYDQKVSDAGYEAQKNAKLMEKFYEKSLLNCYSAD
jgi:glycosyltransferase involved in cell wall biosynthesis